MSVGSLRLVSMFAVGALALSCASPTPTPAPTLTTTPTATATSIPTATPAPMATATPAPPAMPAPTATSSPAPAPTWTPTPRPTRTPTPTPPPTWTPVPTWTPTPLPMPTLTPTPVPTPTPAPTSTPVPTPTPLYVPLTERFAEIGMFLDGFYYAAAIYKGYTEEESSSYAAVYRVSFEGFLRYSRQVIGLSQEDAALYANGSAQVITARQLPSVELTLADALASSIQIGGELPQPTPTLFEMLELGLQEGFATELADAYTRSYFAAISLRYTEEEAHRYADAYRDAFGSHFSDAQLVGFSTENARMYANGAAHASAAGQLPP